jgi:hypothetical protein
VSINIFPFIPSTVSFISSLKIDEYYYWSQSQVLVEVGIQREEKQKTRTIFGSFLSLSHFPLNLLTLFFVLSSNLTLFPSFSIYIKILSFFSTELILVFSFEF